MVYRKLTPKMPAALPHGTVSTSAFVKTRGFLLLFKVGETLVGNRPFLFFENRTIIPR